MKYNMSAKTVKEIVQKSNRRSGKLPEQDIDAEFERMRKEDEICWVSAFGDLKQFEKFLEENLPASEYHIEYDSGAKELLINFRIQNEKTKKI